MATLCQQLLDYCATYPNAGLRIHKCDMVLNIHLDASYLIAPYAKSRISGYFFLSSNNTNNPQHNAPIHVECKTLRHVVTSSAERETAAAFHNAQTPIHIRYILNQLGYSQPPTPIVLDNSNTDNFIKNNITQKRSKSWDTKYYLLREKHIQKQLNFIWKKSELNLADYHTKHFPATYHHQICHNYLLDFPHNTCTYVAC